MDRELDSPSVCVHFQESCPEGGWHIESGIIIESNS